MINRIFHPVVVFRPHISPPNTFKQMSNSSYAWVKYQGRVYLGYQWQWSSLAMHEIFTLHLSVYSPVLWYVLKSVQNWDWDQVSALFICVPKGILLKIFVIYLLMGNCTSFDVCVLGLNIHIMLVAKLQVQAMMFGTNSKLSFFT